MIAAAGAASVCAARSPTPTSITRADADNDRDTFERRAQSPTLPPSPSPLPPELALAPGRYWPLPGALRYGNAGPSIAAAQYDADRVLLRAAGWLYLFDAQRGHCQPVFFTERPTDVVDVAIGRHDTFLTLSASGLLREHALQPPFAVVRQENFGLSRLAYLWGGMQDRFLQVSLWPEGPNLTVTCVRKEAHAGAAAMFRYLAFVLDTSTWQQVRVQHYFTEHTAAAALFNLGNQILVRDAPWTLLNVHEDTEKQVSVEHVRGMRLTQRLPQPEPRVVRHGEKWLLHLPLTD